MCAAFLTRHRRDEAGLRGTRGSREAGDAAMRPGACYRLALRRSHNCYGRPNSVCPSVAIFLPYTASLCLGDRMLRIVLAVVAQLVVVGSVFAEPISLKGDKLREVLADSILEIDTPLKTTIPVQVGRDGLVSGEAGVLASTLGAAHDRGRWWVDGNKLCVKFFRWFEAQTHCMTVEQEGNRLSWRNETGEKGTATITKAAVNVVAARLVPTAPTPSRTSTSSPKASPTLSPASPAPVERRPLPSTTSTSPSPPEALSSAATPSKTPDQVVEEQSPPQPQETAQGSGKLVEALKFAGSEFLAAVFVGDGAPPKAYGLGARLDLPAPLPPPQPSPNVKARVTTVSPVDFRIASYRVARFTGGALVIRDGPSERYASVGFIPRDGKGVQIVGQCVDEWCPVQHHATQGWVNSSYLAPEKRDP